MEGSPSEDTERGEKDYFLSSISEVESDPTDDKEDAQGYEDSVQRILCYRILYSALKHFSFLNNSSLKG